MLLSDQFNASKEMLLSRAVLHKVDLREKKPAFSAMPCYTDLELFLRKETTWANVYT